MARRCWVLSEEKEDIRTRCKDDVNLTVTLTHTVARFQPEVTIRPAFVVTEATCISVNDAAL
jgi:hypothetical protein